MQLVPYSYQGGSQEYSFPREEMEKIDTLFGFLRPHEMNGLEIPLFKLTMAYLFPGLLLRTFPSSGEREEYRGFTREGHAYVEAYAPLNSDAPTNLELRLYPLDNGHVRIGLVALNYALHPIDDLVEELKTVPYRMVSIDSVPDKARKSGTCSLAAVHDIHGVLQRYAQARTLFKNAKDILSQKFHTHLEELDLETLYHDKEKDHNRVIRELSRKEYNSLLCLLVSSTRNEGKSS